MCIIIKAMKEQSEIKDNSDLKDDVHTTLYDFSEHKNEEESDGKSTNFKKFLLYFGMFGVNTTFGFVEGFTPIFIHEMALTEEMKLTRSEASWVASLAALNMVLGSFVAGWLLELCGRKSTLLASILINFVGWCSIILANNVWWILCGKILNGFGIGLSIAAAICFLSDVSTTEQKEFLVTTFLMWISLGTFTSNLIGTFCTWRTLAIISGIVVILPELSLLSIPESFIWYINHKKIPEAKKSFMWYRGNSQEAVEEFEQLRSSFKEESNKEQNLKDLLKNICSKEFLKPFFVVSVVYINTQFSSYGAIISYSLTIFKKTIPTINEYASMLLVDTCKLVTCAIAPLVIRKCKLRPVAIISSIGVIISLICFSITVYFSKLYPENTVLNIAPLLSMLGFMASVGSGILPLKHAVAGILFPPATKGFGIGVTCTINALCYFLVVKTNLDLTETFGHSITFAVYAFIVFVCTVIIYFKLPETKGKTVTEIQEFFSAN